MSEAPPPKTGSEPDARRVGTPEQHTAWMDVALRTLDEAVEHGEVPIASLLVLARCGRVVGRGWNEYRAKRDPTGHAEVMAFRDAAGRYPEGADDLVLVTTLEPCVMCYGMALTARVAAVVYALPAPSNGGLSRVCPPDGTLRPAEFGHVRYAAVRECVQQWHDANGSHPDSFIGRLLQSLPGSPPPASRR